MQGNNSVKIDKIKGVEGWGIWKFQMKILLISQKLFKVVTGTTGKPAQINELTATPEDKEKYAKDFDAWYDSDSNAQKFIAMALDRQPTLYIINCETSKEI